MATVGVRSTRILWNPDSANSHCRTSASPSCTWSRAQFNSSLSAACCITSCPTASNSVGHFTHNANSGVRRVINTGERSSFETSSSLGLCSLKTETRVTTSAKRRRFVPVSALLSWTSSNKPGLTGSAPGFRQVGTLKSVANFSLFRNNGEQGAQLQTAVTTYTKQYSGPLFEPQQVDLVAAVHIADREYFSSLQLVSDLNCNSRRSAYSLISKAKTASLQSANKDDAILLVGVTGGTGSSVLNGLLTSGVEHFRLRVLTRNPESNAARNFLAHGVQVIAGDLDDGSSVKDIVKGVGAIYCHATSKDAAKADPEGVVRAERLAKAAASAGVEHIVYNSSGGAGHGISQVEQKHNIEAIFKDSGIPTTNLQATMFMEEFWKVYTRPQIIKGTFPFSMPGDKPLQLLAVKDMGLAAGIALKQPEKYGGVSLELAGDELTPVQMCEAYSKAQGSTVSHFSPPKFLFWFLNRDLYRISKFLSEEGYRADIYDCRRRFPGLLTFSEFLELTCWGDAYRSYADGFQY